MRLLDFRVLKFIEVLRVLRKATINKNDSIAFSNWKSIDFIFENGDKLI